MECGLCVAELLCGSDGLDELHARHSTSNKTSDAERWGAGVLIWRNNKGGNRFPPCGFYERYFFVVVEGFLSSLFTVDFFSDAGWFAITSPAILSNVALGTIFFWKSSFFAR